MACLNAIYIFITHHLASVNKKSENKIKQIRVLEIYQLKVTAYPVNDG